MPPSSMPLIAVVVLAVLAPFSWGQSVCSMQNGSPSGGNEYMCVDWTVGSRAMETAQGQYQSLTGESVIFGVGSYGSEENGNMGKCYKFTVDSNDEADVIGQVTNFGADIGDGQFDMQMGGGGFGVWNACKGGTDRTWSDSAPCNDGTYDIPVYPLFNGGEWGERCGGHQKKSGCSDLPDYPTELNSVPNGEYDLKTLCTKAFDWRVRADERADPNPIITSGVRIACPDALVAVTGLRRWDDDQLGESMVLPGKLTSTMDCCAPAGAYSSNTINADPNNWRVTPCTNDGYTRV